MIEIILTLNGTVTRSYMRGSRDTVKQWALRYALSLDPTYTLAVSEVE